MKRIYSIPSIIIILLFIRVFSQSSSIKSYELINNETAVIINNQIHENYGVSYPITYIFSYQQPLNNIKVYKKHLKSANWSEITPKTTSDYFNGIEAFRINPSTNELYISVAFSAENDTIYIKAENNSSNLQLNYKGIAKYYDNRNMVVTASADDWHRSFDSYFVKTINKFRQYNLPLTCGVVTDRTANYNSTPWTDDNTWKSYQEQLDKGLVEITAHSRNHLHTEYHNADYEVNGCKNDIISQLKLPENYCKGTKQYVYIWIAPYGDYSNTVEEQIINGKFLAARFYKPNETSVSKWNNSKNLFEPFNMTVELGKPVWGGGENDPDILKSMFDEVYKQNGVYHIMCHPHVIHMDVNSAPYIDTHLSYISNRKDIWYTSLGHLHLYSMIYQTSFLQINTEIENSSNLPAYYALYQNYPNPFNPSTTIAYQVAEPGFISIKVYDILGKEIQELVNEYKQKGNYKVEFNSRGYTSGLYFYVMNAPGFRQTKKLIILK